MATFSGMFPVRPGKEDALRAWMKEIASGARKAEFAALQREADVTRETITLQETPAGSFMLVWFEGDVDKNFADIATRQDEFTTWHRAQLQDVTGIDLSAPPEGPGPEMLLDWRP